MNFTNKSWKTTTTGVLSIVGGIGLIVTALKNHSFSTEVAIAAATAIMGGLGLILARDNDKSSEDVGADAGTKATKAWAKSNPPSDGGFIGLRLLLVLGAFTLLVTMLLCAGCAGTSAQRILLLSAEGTASTVNAAYDTWAGAALLDAKARLPEGATPEQLVNEVKRTPDGRTAIDAYDKWRAGMLVFTASNKTATSGTNAADVLASQRFKEDLAATGNNLLSLIERLTHKPQPRIAP